MDTTVSVKSIDDLTAVVQGYGVIFGGRDLFGDTFAKDTNYDLDYVPVKKIFYDHSKRDPVRHEIGSLKSASIRVDDVGIWIEAEIDRSKKYANAILKMVDKGILGWSSGTAEHLIRGTNTGAIKQWPIIEWSMTPTPAEPRTIAYTALKSLADDDPELKQLLSTVGDEAETTEKIVLEEPSEKAVTTVQDNGEKKMPEGITVITQAERPTDWKTELGSFLANWKAETIDKEVEGVKSTTDSLNAKIDKILAFAESSPALKRVGYMTDDGGEKDPATKSFGDFLLAVKRKDTTRLTKIYRAQKDLGEDSGVTGGYLIPQDYATTLLQLSAMNNPITSLVTRVPVGTDSGRYPALDQYITPVAGSGQTAFAAGVVATPVEAGAVLTKTEPSFEMLEWRLHKVGGYTEVDNELIEDSPASIEALLTGLFGIAIAARKERAILRGTGSGEPMGILNSAAAIGVNPSTNDHFTWPDVGAMWARFRSAGGTPVWCIHPSMWPDLMVMQIGTTGPTWQGDPKSGQSGSGLNGYSIVTSEHLPQRTHAGGVSLLDLKAYLLFERSGLSIAYSEHAAFVNDQATWRFTERLDGKTWLRAPITLADPTGSYTLSPFVYHND